MKMNHRRMGSAMTRSVRHRRSRNRCWEAELMR